jgi:hypothetical protein
MRKKSESGSFHHLRKEIFMDPSHSLLSTCDCQEHQYPIKPHQITNSHIDHS